MNKFIICFMLFISSLSATDKLYLDKQDMDTSQDQFYIHVGNNEWIQSTALYSDETGMYTLDCHIIKSLGNKKSYASSWKCPYCYRYWPIGKSCENKDCPSRYK